jgi:ketosteroid isomerase-like protein
MIYKGLKGVFSRMAAVPLVLAIVLDTPGLYAKPVLPHNLPHTPKHEIHREIEAMEEQWRQALLTNNIAVIDRLLADDYTAITSNGTIETKAETLSAHKEGRRQFLSLDISDRKIRVYGNTAVVTSRADVTLKNEQQQEITGKFRYTRVYNRNSNGQWKIVSFESSRIGGSDDRDAH